MRITRTRPGAYSGSGTGIWTRCWIRGWDDQVVLDTTWHYRYTSSFRSEEDITITTENDRGTGRLLMFRDSFGNAVLPFFAQAFREAEFSRAVPYRLDLTAARQADAVVVDTSQMDREESLAALITLAKERLGL